MQCQESLEYDLYVSSARAREMKKLTTPFCSLRRMAKDEQAVPRDPSSE
jgi:hypothetical protein